VGAGLHSRERVALTPPEFAIDLSHDGTASVDIVEQSQRGEERRRGSP
jgi:hypothetical protein